MTASLRERSRDLLRAELAEAMYDVFAEEGFDAVTVEEVAARAGISRATFFRYFSSKEDAVLVAVEASSFDLAGAVAALEAVEGESAWAAIRRALEPQAQRARRHQSRARSRARMITGVGSIRARLAERRFEQEAQLTQVFAERFAIDQAKATTLAALAFTAMDLSWRRWAAQEKRPLGAIMDEVFATAAEVTVL